MKKLNLIIAIIVAAAAGFFLWAWGQSGIRLPRTLGNDIATTSFAFKPIDNSDGWAEIEVLPLNLASSEWSFGVSLSAHQETDADLTKAAILTDDKGDALLPIRWDDPNPSWHHRKGTLVFPAPPSKPRSITLTIANIGGVATRTFSWKLP